MVRTISGTSSNPLYHFLGGSYSIDIVFQLYQLVRHHAAFPSRFRRFEKFQPQGVAQVICTDISRDGMLCGPSSAFYAALQQRFPTVEITVSGGIASLDDIRRLDEQGLRSVIVGKALYEGRITLEELGRCLRNG